MQTLQSKAKAIVALVLGFLGPLATFYQVNQNLTLKQLVAAVLSGLVAGVVVHQVPNKGVASGVATGAAPSAAAVEPPKPPITG